MSVASVPPRGVRVRWSPVRQNIEFELQSADADLAILQASLAHIHSESELTSEPQRVLTECEKLVAEARVASQAAILQEVLIYQLLLEMRQKLLLIQMIDQVEAKWFSIRRRLAEAGGGGRAHADDERARKRIDAFFERTKSPRKGGGEAGLAAEEPHIRQLIKEFKIIVDNRVIDECWRAVTIRRYTYAYSTLILALIAFAIVWAGFEMGQGAGFVWLPATDKMPAAHGVLLCAIFGFIGGCISTLAALEAPRASGPPLAQISVARPVIGAAAGFALWAVTALTPPTFFHIGYPALYAAMALGFSERLFLGGLRRVAARAEAAIGSATGQGGGS
jgi:hypothetical protein